MPSLHYLTVQDVLWVNLQVTKKVQHFNYARLEEATFYQYAYGESNSLLPQAGRLIAGFLKMKPFDAGNEATAFVACLAFLTINGATPTLDDASAPAWFSGIESKGVKPADAIASAAQESHDDAEHHGGPPDVKGAIRQVLVRYESTIEKLASASPSRA